MPLTISTKTPKDWQPQHIDRLWSYWGTKPHHLEQYFSSQVGHAVVQFLGWTGKLQGNVLDYGCGPGFLLEHLLEADVQCWGADTSVQAVTCVNDKFAKHPNWRGSELLNILPSNFEPASFDVVTCIETLEHLDDQTLDGVINDIKRLIKPGGIAMFTTPYAESLDQHMTFCPFCSSEFHYVQHMRSIDVPTMTQFLESRGLEVVFCSSLSFRDFQRNTLPQWYDLSPRTIGNVISSATNRLLDKLSPRSFPQTRAFQERLAPGPHLCAIATVK